MVTHIFGDPDRLGLAIVFLILAALLVGIIISSIRSKKEYREKYDRLDDDVEMEEPVAVGAVVLSKRMDGEYTGSAETPSYHQLYYVTFKTDGGEIKEYSVSKEMFDEIYEGQSSTLLTVEGDFFWFGDGEDITL